MTAGWLRREHQIYQLLAGKQLAPELVGWVDGERPCSSSKQLKIALPWAVRLLEIELP
jgi:hypothetical protein